MAGCSLARAITTTIITAAVSAAGGWGIIITIIMATATITIITAIIGNYDKYGKWVIAIR